MAMGGIVFETTLSCASRRVYVAEFHLLCFLESYLIKLRKLNSFIYFFLVKVTFSIIIFFS